MIFQTPSQERGDTLPGAGQQGRFAANLRQPGRDPARLGPPGGGHGAALHRAIHDL